MCALLRLRSFCQNLMAKRKMVRREREDEEEEDDDEVDDDEEIIDSLERISPSCDPTETFENESDCAFSFSFSFSFFPIAYFLLFSTNCVTISELSVT